MADEKPKPTVAPAPQKDNFVEGVWILLIFLVLSLLVFGIINFTQKSSSILKKGWRSFLPQELMLTNTRSVSSLANPFNARVIASKDNIIVLDEAGGDKIGTQKFGAKGKIIQGPIIVGGQAYYYVQFENPPSGWVKEGDIVYQDGEQSVFVKALLFLWKIIYYIKYTLWFLIVVMSLYIIYLVRDLTLIRKANKEKNYPVVNSAKDKIVVNARWEKILKHTDSLNENDWRLAIIEADIVLSDLLEKMNLNGDSIGEKLKSVSRGDFKTLDLAWEAHKVRNEIAHSGSDFHISQHEVLRVINLYKSVFDEFDYI